MKIMSNMAGFSMKVKSWLLVVLMINLTVMYILEMSVLIVLL